MSVTVTLRVNARILGGPEPKPVKYIIKKVKGQLPSPEV